MPVMLDSAPQNTPMPIAAMTSTTMPVMPPG